MYACIYVSIYLSIYLCMYVCMHACMYVYIYISIYVYVSLCVHVYINMYIYIIIYIYEHTVHVFYDAFWHTSHGSPSARLGHPDLLHVGHDERQLSSLLHLTQGPDETKPTAKITNSYPGSVSPLVPHRSYWFYSIQSPFVYYFMACQLKSPLRSAE